MSTQIKSKNKTYNLKFDFGELVTLKMFDWEERVIGMITAIHIRLDMISYNITWSDTRQERMHFEFELIEAPENES